MLWILIALTAIWVIGSIAATSFAGASLLVIALALAVAALQYWERRHPT